MTLPTAPRKRPSSSVLTPDSRDKATRPVLATSRMPAEQQKHLNTCSSQCMRLHTLLPIGLFHHGKSQSRHLQPGALEQMNGCDREKLQNVSGVLQQHLGFYDQDLTVWQQSGMTCSSTSWLCLNSGVLTIGFKKILHCSHFHLLPLHLQCDGCSRHITDITMEDFC